jgi:predicted neutral ceramidase superfamily lipid hydrolase
MSEQTKSESYWAYFVFCIIVEVLISLFGEQRTLSREELEALTLVGGVFAGVVRGFVYVLLLSIFMKFKPKLMALSATMLAGFLSGDILVAPFVAYSLAFTVVHCVTTALILAYGYHLIVKQSRQKRR